MQMPGLAFPFLRGLLVVGCQKIKYQWIFLMSCGLVVLLFSCLSILSTKQPDNKTTRQQICLEGNTERSESNPGRSLGITNKNYAAVWKTVPKLKING